MDTMDYNESNEHIEYNTACSTIMSTPYLVEN